MASKDQTLELLRRQVKERRENQLAHFEPYPKQLEFFAATADHAEVCLRAGNQVGKTLSAAYMASVFATGLYPDWWPGRRWDRPTRGWACGESAVAVRDVSQRKLCGPPGDDALFGTGMIPKHLLVGKILGHGAGGAYDTIKVKHVSGGTSEISFKSYDQARSKWQGSTLDWGWCDEEPPSEHYMELLARLIATRGLAFSSFTPLQGMNAILPRFNERNPEALRSRRLVAMRLDDAHHLRDPEARAALLSTFPEHERRARIDGLPSLGSGAVFEDVELSNLIVPLRIDGTDIVHGTIGALETRAWALLWSIDFGIDHPFAAVLLAHDRDSDTIFVLAELKIRGGVPAIHASRMKAIAANVKVAWPHDGTQRDKGSGEQLADIYKREGLLMLPNHATFAKGGYSTEAGIMEMLSRMRSDRFKVASHLVEWQEEFQGYHRKEGVIVKVNDDLLSATRVGIMQLRSASTAPLGSVLVDRRGQRMAKDIDYDLFAGD